jgi:adenylate cyclase
MPLAARSWLSYSQVFRKTMPIRVVYSYENKDKIRAFRQSEVVIGRPMDGVPVDLDLSPDTKVSRLHARLSFADGNYWIEDLGSLGGTFVSGKQIKDRGKCALTKGDVVTMGKTVLRIAAETSGTGIPDHSPTVGQQAENRLPTARSTVVVSKREEPAPETSESEIPSDTDDHPDRNGDIAGTLSARDLDFASVGLATAKAGEDARKLLYEIPLELARVSRLDSLFQIIVKRVVDVISGAERGALLLIEKPSGNLLLKAHYPVGAPRVSTTMANRAIQSREAFIWSRRVLPFGTGGLESVSSSRDMPASISGQGVESVLYAPLIWQDEVLGVVCVDSARKREKFRTNDLHLLLAVAQYSAMAVANHQLQAALKQAALLRDNLLRQFSPEVARHLVNSRRRVRLGGERSTVTILCSDIRGFTRLSNDMPPDDVVDLLNDYFSQLIPVIFAHDGTVDKYIGDGILAVFGSPEPDSNQYEKAVRAAAKMQSAMSELNLSRRKRGLTNFEIGIGVHAGEVVHGFIGTDNRMEFTVIGDAVNRASRYCDAAQRGEVLISPDVYERVWQIVEVEHTTIPTKQPVEGALEAYRLIALKSAGSAAS